jgi:predicted acylesterase/phospholipase RssA
MSGRLPALAALLGALMLAGCVTLPREPFTASDQALAAVPGFPHARYAPDDPALTSLLISKVRPDADGQVDVLALSGGGANGAYGAGLLYGWSKAPGGRPDFRIVTGVSTGALMAPFAFLGTSTDEDLRQAYTGQDAQGILQIRGAYGLFTPGLYSKLPLERLVRRYVTDDTIRAIAAEYAKGRRLMVATTDLDTERLVVWDMGAIAAHGGAAARDLFVKVLVASASVPGVYAPTMIDVRGGGRAFEEMHVDGQTEGAFFAVPEDLLLMKRLPSEPFKVRLYVVVNGQLDDVFAETPRATVPILARAMEAANKASIRAVVNTTFEFCLRRGCTVRLAALPQDAVDNPLDFSKAHLHGLFDAGEAAGRSGAAWRDTGAPPAAKGRLGRPPSGQP